MRVQKPSLRRSAVLLVVFVIGCFVGLMTSSYLYYEHVFSKAADERAIALHQNVIALSHLRLGEIDTLIDVYETRVDSEIRTISQNLRTPPNDSSYKVLKAAKTYRELYPSTSKLASKVKDSLKDIPKLQASKCENSLRRLVEKAGEKVE